jgi:translation initiation factor IF-2
MSMSTTVSAKIPRALRERLREKGVNVSSVVRKALEKELQMLEEAEIKGKLDSLKTSLVGKVSKNDVVKAVRSSRDERILGVA